MKALVLSGGGVWGAYQVGVLHKLYKEALLQEKDFRYDVIAGVSAGALNGAVLTAHADEQGLFRAVETLVKLWLHEIKGNQSIYNHRLFGPLSGFFAKSLYSTKPLRRLLNLYAQEGRIQDSEVRFFVGAWESESDQYLEFDSSINEPMTDYVMASSAFPLLFPPVLTEEGLLFDGGVKNSVPHRWLNLYSRIEEIDLILTAPPIQSQKEKKPVRHLFDVARAAIEGMTLELFYNDLLPYARHLHRFPDTKIRVYAPTRHFTSDPFTFEPSVIQKLYLDARTSQPITLQSFFQNVSG